MPSDSLSQPKVIGAGQPKLLKTQGTGDHSNVHCGLQDRSGNLWFGTTGEGIYRYDGSSFFNFTEGNGLASNEVWCIYEDRDSNLWFGTGDGVCRYNPAASAGTETFFTLRINATAAGYFLSDQQAGHDPSVKNAVWGILQDKAGKFWFGTSNGVYCYDGGSITHFLSGNISNANGLKLKHI